jgi:DNA-3-methyladenine glycosylase II
VRELEGADFRPTEKALYLRGEAWRPYRGVATHLLWDYYLARRRGDIAAPETHP